MIFIFVLTVKQSVIVCYILSRIIDLTVLTFRTKCVYLMVHTSYSSALEFFMCLLYFFSTQLCDKTIAV